MLTWILAAIYIGMASIALGNWLLMRRPKTGEALLPGFTVLIPARNEADNLQVLIPQLKQAGAKHVVVFDDESGDSTASVAESAGAIVLRPKESLPVGWTGKNRACHELGVFAATLNSDWWIFLDADVRIQPDFFAGLGNYLPKVPPSVGCLTGFPNLRPGKFPEPLVLAWVGWILLCSNPFGLVAITGKGHNRFTNGQITIWRPEIWTRLLPNQAAKNRILEDVVIGRYLCQQRVGVEVLNLSELMDVQMYTDWRSALNGMSKNSYEIMNSIWGSLGLVLFLILVATGWMIHPILFIPFALSGLFSFLVCRPLKQIEPLLLLAGLLMPLIVLIGAGTICRSIYWKLSGKTSWKGRTYS